MVDKIITISINPALDVTLWIETMDFSEPNQTTREEIYAAGKSINVSRVLASLQTPSVSLGICGDDNSKLFATLLQKDGVKFDFVTIPGYIRENLTLIIPDGRVLKISAVRRYETVENSYRGGNRGLQQCAIGFCRQPASQYYAGRV